MSCSRRSLTDASHFSASSIAAIWRPLPLISIAIAVLTASCGATARRGARAAGRSRRCARRASRPAVTMRRPSTDGAERHLAIGGLVVGADHHHELLVLVGADRALVDEHRVLRPSAWPRRTRANWPGMSRPSRLSNTARTRTVPLLASTWLSMSCRRPGAARASSAGADLAPGCARWRDARRRTAPRAARAPRRPARRHRSSRRSGSPRRASSAPARRDRRRRGCPR